MDLVGPYYSFYTGNVESQDIRVRVFGGLLCMKFEVHELRRAFSYTEKAAATSFKNLSTTLSPCTLNPRPLTNAV